MATHSSTLAWKIPWTEEPGRLQSMGSLRVGQDWATSLSPFLSGIGEGNDNPLQCSCLKNPRDGGAWWAAVYGVTQSCTRLKWLSSSSSIRPSRTNTQRRCPFHHKGLEWESRKSRDTWSNRQVWPWSTKWSRARLTEFCQENGLVILNTLFQQHKRQLYTWISPHIKITKSDWLYSL